MENIKITFIYVILKINQLNISSAAQVLQKLLEELISEGWTNILRESTYLFPLAFFVHQSLL